MIASLIFAFFLGKLTALGIMGILAWFFFEFLGGILTLIIDNWYIVLTAVIVIPFVLYWIAIGIGKFFEFTIKLENYLKK